MLLKVHTNQKKVISMNKMTQFNALSTDESVIEASIVTIQEKMRLMLIPAGALEKYERTKRDLARMTAELEQLKLKSASHQDSVQKKTVSVL